jgi:four helix bundle protein
MINGKPGSFVEWEETVNPAIRNDPLWKFMAYPKALFVYELTWADCEYLSKDERGKTVARQLIRSVGSIGANIEEGFGRGFGKSYAYHMRITLGEARESRGWYWRGHNLIPENVVDHRLQLLGEIIALLTTNIKKQKDYKEK